MISAAPLCNTASRKLRLRPRWGVRWGSSSLQSWNFSAFSTVDFGLPLQLVKKSDLSKKKKRRKKSSIFNFSNTNNVLRVFNSSFKVQIFSVNSCTSTHTCTSDLCWRLTPVKSSRAVVVWTQHICSKCFHILLVHKQSQFIFVLRSWWSTDTQYHIPKWKEKEKHGF